MRLLVAPLARADIKKILDRSEADFGPDARQRYRDLFVRGFQFLRDNPRPVSSRELATPRHALLSLHLRNIPKARGGGVARPPHLIVYREVDGVLLVERILHEKMELLTHLDLTDR